MAHWASLTSTVVRAAEWRLLRSTDVAYLTAQRDMLRQEQAAVDSPNTVSERPMTPELFDAIF